MELTRRQRNEMFEVLRQKGIDPAECELITSKDVRIAHAPTGSYFTFFEFPVYGGTAFRFSLSVADGPSTASEPLLLIATWHDLLEQLQFWAEEVHYVAETPDYWADLKQAPEILAAAQAPDASNAPFTPAEQAEISNKLDAIKKLVRQKFELTSEQQSAVNDRLDEIKEATERLGRKDWLMLFYGGLFSLIITDAVPPSVIQGILSTVIHGIAYFFGFGGTPSIITA